MTQSKDGNTIYVLYLAEENETRMPAQIWFSQLDLPESAKVYLLGKEKDLRWDKIGNGFSVNIPYDFQKEPPCEYVWVLKIEK